MPHPESPTLNPAEAPEAVATWLESARPRIDAELDRRLPQPSSLPDSDAARSLLEAARYAALGPGKRLRPALCLAACAAAGGREDDALPAAAALELVHAYTLVHDDLPAMDDDDTRRGRATVHRAYDEATAILVGDALLTAAFAALADLGGAAADAVAVLAARAGGTELLAGQARDLAAADRAPASVDEAEVIHRDKTGALFSAATELGAIAAGAADDARRALARYGMALGIAFQHADDRDDDEHAHLRDAAGRRMKELAAEGEAIARDLGAGDGPLVAFAEWLGSRA